MYVNEADVVETPFEKNSPEDFDLNYPEKTKGTTPKWPESIDKLEELMKKVKDSKKYNKIEFRITFIARDKDFKIKPEDEKVLEEKLKKDGVEEPKIITIDIILL